MRIEKGLVRGYGLFFARILTSEGEEYPLDASDPVVSIRIPDVGGPTWNWALESVPVWVAPNAAAGQNPATISLTLAASTLPPGIHRDTMVVALTFGGYRTHSRSNRTRYP